jgi:hypothetical protein
MAASSARDAHQHDGMTPFHPAWVVPLQPEGKGRPVFVFPSSHSGPQTMAVEAGVARHVGRERPFWGLGRDDAHLDLVRTAGVAALGAENVRWVRAIQERGPYLLYGNCLGGYLAWETARQLLDAGEEIAGILFYEVPLRSDFANVLPGPMPVHSANVWRLAHYYRPPELPVDLTHLMTAGWHDSRWWEPWRHVARGRMETVVVPGETEAAFVDREARIATHVRDWIATAEAQLAVPTRLPP